MSNQTMRLQLPLLQPAQAQKHVTVNEALMRLDGLTNAVLESTTATTPPGAVVDGQCWAVPPGAQDSWSGQGGRMSYARVWVTRPNQAARFSATLAATPSVNVTPSMTKGNWFAPFRRRHVLAAA